MKYSLTTKDFLRGLLLAVGMAVLTVVQNSIAAGAFKFDWQNIGLVAAGTAITYLLKNFFTDGIAQSKNTLKDAAVSPVEAQKVDQIETKTK